MSRRILLVMGLSVLLAGCAQGADESFNVGIANEYEYKLASGRLESDEPGVSTVGRPGQFMVYSHGNKRRVPEKITFIWTAKGEEAEHRAVFMLRQQIPSHVFRLIGSRKRPLHMLMLDIRGIGGRAECSWMFFRIDGGPDVGTKLEEGVVAGEILP